MVFHWGVPVLHCTAVKRRLLFQIQPLWQGTLEHGPSRRHCSVLPQLYCSARHHPQAGEWVLDQAEAWHGPAGGQLACHAWSLRLHWQASDLWLLLASGWLDESCQSFGTVVNASIKHEWGQILTKCAFCGLVWICWKYFLCFDWLGTAGNMFCVLVGRG